MSRTLIGLVIFFLLVSTAQLYFLHERIEEAPEIKLSEVVNPASERASELEKGLLTLEHGLIQQRYHQANTSLMNRIWLKYLGFVTGMILAVVGSVFILGKMKEDTTELEGESSAMKFNIKSSSPGLIMIVLGTVLMMTTILSHNRIDVMDGNTYLLKENLKSEDKLLNLEKEPEPKENTEGLDDLRKRLMEKRKKQNDG
jgi:hypothetical protein